MTVNYATGEITEQRRPEIPLQIITPNDVRASISRARRSLEKAAVEIVWQIEMEGWRTLGYSSWGAMREAEYGGAAFMVPNKNRPELVSRIRAAGLTQQEIADTAGIARNTVAADLNAQSEHSESQTITNSLGQQRPATYARSDEPDDSVIDAEIVEDDEPTPDATTDPAHPAEPAIAVTCPTCHGTGKVTR